MQVLGVPELWRFEQGKLQINLLQAGNISGPQIVLSFQEYP